MDWGYIPKLKIPRARNLKVKFNSFENGKKTSSNFKNLLMDLILTGSSFRKIEEFLAKQFTFLSRQSISKDI